MLTLTLPSPSLLLTPKTLTLKSPLFPKHLSISQNPRTLTLKSSIAAAADSISADLISPDYSFLDSTDHSAAIAAASLSAGSSVLISFPTVALAARVAGTGARVVAVHDSLFVLAEIKEGDDKVRCFQGEIATVPASLLPFDAVLVCYFPAVGVAAGELLRTVAACCSQGARLVITFDQGRKKIEQDHRQQYPDLVKFDLPDRATLEKAANDHSFVITEFVDEPNSYLAVLKFDGSGN